MGNTLYRAAATLLPTLAPRSQNKRAQTLLLECPGDLLTWQRVRPGTTLTLLRGKAWITQQGDPADYLLSPGETLRLNHAGRTVIQALHGPCRIAIGD